MITPRLFVAPNRACPSIGRWLTLDCAWDAEDIRAAIQEAACGMKEPDIPCVEGIPKACYNAPLGTIDADKLAEWLALDEDEGDIVALYWDELDSSADIESILENWQGYYDNGGDFAEEMADQCGDIPKDIPSWIVIDWEASWECNLRFDYDYTRTSEGLAIWRQV